jgi:branched-chain amino acid transport system permease protein
MPFEVFLILLQDGITNGAIYALLALTLVLLFTVTRVLYLAQGEFVTLGAMTYVTLVDGGVPGTVWLVLAAGIVAAVFDLLPTAARRAPRGRTVALTLLGNVGLPLVLVALAMATAGAHLPPPLLAILAVVMVAPLGPMLYRIAFQPVAEASILTLMIIGVAVHFALTGIVLYLFGPDGVRTDPFVGFSVSVGGQSVAGQSIVVVGASLLLIAALYAFFRTLPGMALRATAVDRIGARLLGIRPAAAGKLAFLLAAGIGAFCGVLIVPITTMYYNSGLMLGLYGFIGAVFGALVSFPAAAAGAVFVGVLGSYAAFWASAYKEAILLLLIIPVLLWLSLRRPQLAEEG